VQRVAVQAGAVAGVLLNDGRELEASMVVSSADPRRSLLEFIEPGWLDPELVRAVRHVRRRGVSARLRVQLDRSPGFGALAIAPSLDYLERAYDDAKHGGVSRQPYVEARCDEQHRLDVHIQYAAQGADCSKLGDTVLAMLSEHWGEAVPREGELLSPQELAQTEGWPEGQAHHAELALDQVLWMRPLPELARYRTRSKACGCAARRCIPARASPAPQDSIVRVRFFAAELLLAVLSAAAAAAEPLPDWAPKARPLPCPAFPRADTWRCRCTSRFRAACRARPRSPPGPTTARKAASRPR
jgi:hypothetical protein